MFLYGCVVVVFCICVGAVVWLNVSWARARSQLGPEAREAVDADVEGEMRLW